MTIMPTSAGFTLFKAGKIMPLSLSNWCQVLILYKCNVLTVHIVDGLYRGKYHHRTETDVINQFQRGVVMVQCC